MAHGPFSTAALLGISALGVTDRGSLAGVVRVHEAANTHIPSCRLSAAGGQAALAPRRRAGFHDACVHRHHVTAPRDEHGMVRHHRIDLVAGRHPPLAEQALVPAAEGDNPLAGIGRLSRMAHCTSATERASISFTFGALVAMNSWWRWLSIGPARPCGHPRSTIIVAR